MASVAGADGLGFLAPHVGQILNLHSNQKDCFHTVFLSSNLFNLPETKPPTATSHHATIFAQGHVAYVRAKSSLYRIPPLQKGFLW